MAETPVPSCCEAASRRDREALHQVDPVLARIQRTVGRPVLHPTEHGLDWEPCSLDCPASVAAVESAGRLAGPMGVGRPSSTPLVVRSLDPEQPVGRRPVRVAVLDLQREETDFAGSLELQFAAADLAFVGHEAELLRVTTGFTGERLVEARDALVERLQASDTEWVALRNHVDDGLIEALAARGIGAIYLDSVAYRGRRPPEGLYSRVQAGDDRVGLLDALDAWLATGTLPPGGALPGSGIDRVLPETLLEPAHYWPAVRFRDGITGEVRPFARHMLVHAYGCPWSADVADNPVYDGVSLDGVKRAGCSYCAIGGDYRKLPVPDYVGFLAAQIGWLAEHAPGAEVVVADEATFSFLDRLIDRLVADGVRPGPLLIKARMNGLIPILDRFERTLETAREHGIEVVCYLLGIENFSEAELARYNKGISQQALVDGLHTLLELEERFAGTFAFTRFNAHGFILYNPWTTLEDLQTNQRFFEALGIRRLSGKAVWSRLRMHRWQPLHALAERDGLLTEDRERFAAVIKREVGYHGDEVPWRFSDPAVELVYALVIRGMRAAPGADEVAADLFAAAVAHATGHRPTEPLSLEALDAETDCFFAEHAALLAGGPGRRRIRDRLEEGVRRLARRSARFRWQLVEVAPAGDRFRVRFEGPGGAREGTVPVGGGSVAWDRPESKAAHLFGRAFDLVVGAGS